MFDNLRDQANATPFYEDEAQFRPADNIAAAPSKPSGNGRFLGMTAGQRFFLAVLLFISVCVLGSMCLLITGKVTLF